MKKIFVLILTIFIIASLALTGCNPQKSETAEVQDETVADDTDTEPIVVNEDTQVEEQTSVEPTPIVEQTPPKEIFYEREGRIVEIRFSNTLQKYEGELLDQKNFNRYKFTTDKELLRSDRVTFILSSKGDISSVKKINLGEAENVLPETIPAPNGPINPETLTVAEKEYIKTNYKLGSVESSTLNRDGTATGAIKDMTRFVEIEYEWTSLLKKDLLVYYIRDEQGTFVDIIAKEKVDAAN